MMYEILREGTEDYENHTLQHYGAKGMRWGVRRFQNEDGSLTQLGKERYGYKGERSARGTARDLNKLDREQTNAKYYADHYSAVVNNKTAKATKKLRKAKKAHDSEKVEKYKKKLEDIKNSKQAKKAEDWKKLYDKSKALTDKIIKQSLKKGYSVYSQEYARVVRRGHNMATSAIGTIGGVALGTVTGFYAVGSNTERSMGKQYRVKDDGLRMQSETKRTYWYNPSTKRRVYIKN